MPIEFLGRQEKKNY